MRPALAYVAGIIDGEGTVYITRQKAKARNASRTDAFTLNMRVAMCHRDTIAFVADTLGVGKVYTSKGLAAAARRPARIWHAGSAGSVPALGMLLPYMLTKRPEAELALEFAALPKTPTGGSVRVDPALTALRLEYFERMKSLKITSKNYFSERDNELARNVL